MNTSVYAYIRPPTDPSISTSIQRSSIIHPSIHPPIYSSIHHLPTHSSTHHPHTPASPSIVYPHTYCPSIHLSCLPTCLQLPSFELMSSFQKLRIRGLSWGYCGDAKVLGSSSNFSTHPKVQRQGTCWPSWLERSVSTHPQVNSQWRHGSWHDPRHAQWRS